MKINKNQMSLTCASALTTDDCRKARECLDAQVALAIQRNEKRPAITLPIPKKSPLEKVVRIFIPKHTGTTLGYSECLKLCADIEKFSLNNPCECNSKQSSKSSRKK